MEEKIISEGKCLFCGKMFPKAGISKHLNEELKKQTMSSENGISFHLKVEASPYFLNLWVDGDASLKNIDQFLRDIWLECCGHLSAFHGHGKVTMTRKTKEVFHKDMMLEYEYDFGSTTGLNIKVIEEFPYKASGKIVLLSRNEPLEILCSSCHKAPATEMCTVCMYEKEAYFCEKCAPKHIKECEDFADYAAMPVVNSPRMGECGYEGGTIDVERDGVFKLEK